MNYVSWLFRWPSCLFLIAVVNFSALSGPFLFDDFSNLADLKSVDQGMKSAADFILEGTSGPTGRPVALATFLWPQGAFPDEPFLFKCVNLFIHLLNVLLVYGIAKLVLIGIGLNKAQATTAALFAMLFWGAHPINQSAVFFVVQRMTLLMSFFALSAMYVFLKYRRYLIGPITIHSFFVVCSIGLLGCLSLFSKEVGVIIPLLLLVFQVTIFSNSTSNSVHQKSLSRIVSWGMIYLPSIIVLVAFTYWIVFKTNPEFSNRDFNMYERLLTQSRVLTDYVLQIFTPRLSGSGLFHDDYVISKSLLNPLDTILSIVVLSLLAICLVLTRKQWKVVSFAGLFFLVGHFIESSFLNLELYFEHRNYLPSIGIAIAIGYGFVKINDKLKPFVALYCALVILLGAYNAFTWGSLNRIAQSWALENKESVRSHVLLARYWGEVGNYKKAMLAIEQTIRIDPSNGTSYFQMAAHKCIKDGSLGVTGFNDLAEGTYGAKYFSLGLSDAVGLMVDILKLEACSGYTADELIGLLTSIVDSKGMVVGAAKYNLNYQLSRLHLLNKNFGGYMNALEKTYKIYPNLQIINTQLNTMIVNTLYSDAQLYVERGQELIKNKRQSSIALKRFEVLNLKLKELSAQAIK